MTTLPGYIAANDALGRTSDLAFGVTFPLLGVPVRIRSNSPDVIALADRTFGKWRDLQPELVAKIEPGMVDVAMHPVQQELLSGEPRPFVHRVHGGCYVASDGVNLLTAQFERARALAFIVPELLKREAHLRQNVLQLLSLLLVTRHDRVPVHAGAVVHNGLAILLAGRSTAGKSTLCYACLRQGFQLLSEDAVYVSRTPSLRLWGLPGALHLLPDAVRFFPELIELQPEVQANGKFKLAIETAGFGPEREARHAERALVCVLARHDAAETLVEPIEPALAIAVLSEDREPGFDLYESTEAVAKALTAGGAYRLTVGYDLSQATAALRRLA